MSLNKKKAREKKLKNTVLYNIGLKCINMILMFLSVPLLLGFLGKERYGIWVTIFAAVNWLNIFDVGLGQGMKLRLTKAFSLNRKEDIKELISSSYFFVLSIVVILAALIFPSYFVFNWSSVFGIDTQYQLEINVSLLILTSFFLLVFSMKLIGIVYASLQHPYMDNLIKTSSQAIFLTLVYLAVFFELKPSVAWLSLFAIAPLFINYSSFNFYFFLVKAKQFIPKLKNVNKASIKELATPGIQFFIIQIGCIVLYSTDNIIILNLLSPEAVADYNVIYKYYSIPFLFYNIYVASHWESIIDAFAKNDFIWIKHKVRGFNKLLFVLAICYLFIYLLEEQVIAQWVGKEKIIDNRKLGAFMVGYFLVSSITTNYIYIINSYGKLRVQLMAYIIIAVLNIPLSFYFVNHTPMSSDGVIFASTLCLLLLMILMPIQYFKIVNQNTSGVWGK